jgi:hypothetical protein
MADTWMASSRRSPGPALTRVRTGSGSGSARDPSAHSTTGPLRRQHVTCRTGRVNVKAGASATAGEARYSNSGVRVSQKVSHASPWPGGIRPGIGRKNGPEASCAWVKAGHPLCLNRRLGMSNASGVQPRTEEPCPAGVPPRASLSA